ncbi:MULTISPECIES: hypothetical protein [unclassified Modestobacter]
MTTDQLPLQRLIWRRMFEMGLSAEEAAQRTEGALSKEAIRGLVAGRMSVYVSDRVARALARSLGVPEHRVRRAAGLPVTEPVGVHTQPHLRIVGRED